MFVAFHFQKKSASRALTAAARIAVLTATFHTTSCLAVEAVVPAIGALLVTRVAPEVSPANSLLGLARDESAAEAFDDTLEIAVHGIATTGNTVFTDEQLSHLLAHLVGRAWTLKQLMGSVRSISALYEQAGYPLVNVSIPEQTLDEGVLKIEVIEGTWGEVLLEHRHHGSDRLLRLATKNLRKGELIRQSDIDRSTMLLADIVGRSISARLRPGAEYSASDFIISGEDKDSLAGNFTLNNFGSVATGRTQANIQLQMNGLAAQGESIALDALSAGEGLNRIGLTSEWPLNVQALRLGLAHSVVNYQLVGEARSIGAHGWAQQSSLWLRQSLVKVGSTALNVQLQFDHLDLDDLASAAPEPNNPRSIQVLGLTLDGDVPSNVQLGSHTRWSLGMASGLLQLLSSSMQAYDAALSETQGQFARINFSTTHSRELTKLYSLNALMLLQWSDRNLDISQKAALGGARSIRAYEPGVLSGDASVSFNLEIKRALGYWLEGQWVGSAFVDYGWIKVNSKPWVDVENEAVVAAFGLGLQGALSKSWRISLSAADTLGAIPTSLQGVRSRRSGVWFELGKSLAF